jgi:hypothetical protein
VDSKINAINPKSGKDVENPLSNQGFKDVFCDMGKNFKGICPVQPPGKAANRKD